MLIQMDRHTLCVQLLQIPLLKAGTGGSRSLRKQAPLEVDGFEYRSLLKMFQKSGALTHGTSVIREIEDTHDTPTMRDTHDTRTIRTIRDTHRYAILRYVIRIRNTQIRDKRHHSIKRSEYAICATPDTQIRATTAPDTRYTIRATQYAGTRYAPPLQATYISYNNKHEN